MLIVNSPKCTGYIKKYICSFSKLMPPRRDCCALCGVCNCKSALCLKFGGITDSTLTTIAQWQSSCCMFVGRIDKQCQTGSTCGFYSNRFIQEKYPVKMCFTIENGYLMRYIQWVVGVSLVDRSWTCIVFIIVLWDRPISPCSTRGSEWPFRGTAWVAPLFTHFLGPLLQRSVRTGCV